MHNTIKTKVYENCKRRAKKIWWKKESDRLDQKMKDNERNHIKKQTREFCKEIKVEKKYFV